LNFYHSLDKINKNAVIIEDENYNGKIIFPDYKFDLNLNTGDVNYTIKKMIEDSRKKYEKEFVLTLTFLDEDGTPIANSTDVSMLTRMSNFQISINGGDRIYNCVNTRYLGSLKLSKPVLTIKDNLNLNKIEKLMFQDHISFTAAVSLTSKRRNNNIKYSTILNDYLESKYSNLREFHSSISSRREFRIQKILNLFFYLCLSQTIALNLCTFVFFSWDFMEPITQCITFINIICGYYYWALTKGDYEIESMIQWIKSRSFLLLPALTHSMLKEIEEVKTLLKDDDARHYH